MTLKPRFLVAFGACFIIASVAVMVTAAVVSAAPDPNWANIKINEISSDNGATPVGDAVELINTGSVDVDITGWRQTDSSAASAALPFAAKLPDGTATTTIPANGFVYFSSTKGLGSGGDGVKVYLSDLTPVDAVTYTGGEAGTDETNNFGALAYARCPNGTGSFFSVGVKSFGASNATACNFKKTNPNTGGSGGSDLPGTCTPEAPAAAGAVPAGAVAWPGSAAPAVADNLCAFETATGPEGRDISGLIFDKTDPSILWAVKNKSWIYKLVKNAGGIYDYAPGWTGGKQIYFPGGVGQPDSEGITQGPDGMLYTTTERDNAASSIALDTVLQFDPNAATLTAVKQWNLTGDFVGHELNPTGDQNLGFEGLTYVPDSYLTANGFVDQHTGATYNPANYPLHGSGLFFLALEKNGHLYAYALNSDGSFQRITDIATGMAGVMDVAYDADLGRIWALCDNTCGVTSTLLKIDANGAFAPDTVLARPAGLPVNNIEGFAVAPGITSADGLTREVVWSDDGIYGTGLGSSTEGHALYRGSLTLAFDTTAPTLVVPANITVNATSPAGATVSFAVSASDSAGGTGLASMSCTPASGSLFPIGTTTVNCTATDNAGNSSDGTFTVHVRSASEQVSVLLTAVNGVGPGSALTIKVIEVQGYVATSNKVQACSGLSSFVGLVAAQKGKKLTVAQANSFTAQANSIRATLGC